VEVNIFDGSDPKGWITQMEHYFSLHDIIDELDKLCYVVLYLDLNWNGGNGEKIHSNGMFLGNNLL
jgi:hypothetical protein